MRQDPRVDRIGLGQLAQGAGKVAYLARIDHRYRQACRGQFAGRRDFIATAGFEHHAADARPFQLLNQCRDAALIVVHTEALVARPQRRIKPRFRHIDADEQLLFHYFLLAFSPALRDTGCLALATVRARRLVSGRDDQTLRTVSKTASGDGLATSGHTQIVGMLKIQGWGAKQVLKSLLWLRRENFNRGHIYVRPAGRHGLSLVDDLKTDALARMKAAGFAPAAVIETSPGNLQAWLKHGETLDEVASTRAAKLLAERFGGDPGSADWRHSAASPGSPTPAWFRACNPLRGCLRPVGKSTGRRLS